MEHPIDADIIRNPDLTSIEVVHFLHESNAIEGVTDKDSLQQAIYAWEYAMVNDVLDTSVVLKAHKILMLHQDLQPDEKGYFRKIPVYVGRREGMTWSLIPEAVKSWCARVMEGSMDAKALHILYERIHPFVDGNGRTGRIFMNWQLKKQGRPIMILNAHERGEYYKWFK